MHQWFYENEHGEGRCAEERIAFTFDGSGKIMRNLDLLPAVFVITFLSADNIFYNVGPMKKALCKHLKQENPQEILDKLEAAQFIKKIDDDTYEVVAKYVHKHVEF